MSANRMPTRKPPPRKMAPPKEQPKTSAAGNHWTGAALKAGMVGGLGLTFLQLVGLIKIPLLLCLELPGYILLLLITGALAGLFASRQIEIPRHALRVGALGGFVTGVIGGLLGMMLAAFGLTFRNLGYGILAQFSSSQLEDMAQWGMTSEVIQIMGSVLFALLIWGVGGTLISMVLGALGGHIYYRLR
jgi:hypothetical protein